MDITVSNVHAYYKNSFLEFSDGGEMDSENQRRALSDSEAASSTGSSLNRSVRGRCRGRKIEMAPLATSGSSSPSRKETASTEQGEQVHEDLQEFAYYSLELSSAPHAEDTERGAVLASYPVSEALYRQGLTVQAPEAVLATYPSPEVLSCYAREKARGRLPASTVAVYCPKKTCTPCMQFVDGKCSAGMSCSHCHLLHTVPKRQRLGRSKRQQLKKIVDQRSSAEIQEVASAQTSVTQAYITKLVAAKARGSEATPRAPRASTRISL